MKKNIEAKNLTRKEKAMNGFKEILSSALWAVVIFAIFYSFFVPNRVTGHSMDQTFADGDLVFTTRGWLMKNEYDYGDVVTFEYDGNVLIKRVIAKPGDHIVIKDTNVIVNDEVLKEDYINNETYGEIDLVIPDGEYFVMGDNRQHSKDSRYFGAVKTEDIMGRVNFGLIPFKGVI